MNFNLDTLKSEERAVFALGSLYGKFGYSRYKMSKFEEYDLYVRNKDFLVSDSVITFTDTDGKLLALKPDVTLSIIKNSKIEGGCQKVYYNENVYRISDSTHSYKEIMQVGLECIGEVDMYHVGEVLSLACESLKTISDECVLDVSSIDIVSSLIDAMALSPELEGEIIRCVSEKNLHEATSICRGAGVDEDKIEALKTLISIHGAPEEVLPALYAKLSSYVPLKSLDAFARVLHLAKESGCGDIIRVDFSVINDMKYYNGIVFKGFISSIPDSVLSGGQYDALVRKMGKDAGAIGFAIYLNLLEGLKETRESFDVDTLILYDDDTDLSYLTEQTRKCVALSKTVSAQKVIPQKLRYKNLLNLCGKEGE